MCHNRLLKTMYITVLSKRFEAVTSNIIADKTVYSRLSVFIVQ